MTGTQERFSPGQSSQCTVKFVTFWSPAVARRKVCNCAFEKMGLVVISSKFQHQYQAFKVQEKVHTRERFQFTGGYDKNLNNKYFHPKMEANLYGKLQSSVDFCIL